MISRGLEEHIRLKDRYAVITAPFKNGKVDEEELKKQILEQYRPTMHGLVVNAPDGKFITYVSLQDIHAMTGKRCACTPKFRGGYGIVLKYGDAEKTISKGYRLTTNNRMELMAVIVGLSQLKYPCNVKLCSDSKYVIDSIEKGWVFGWQKKGWKKADGKPALNVDLWQQLLPLLEIHNLEYIWIKGHAGHKYNELCDKLAVEAYNGENLEEDTGVNA